MSIYLGSLYIYLYITQSRCCLVRGISAKNHPGYSCDQGDTSEMINCC
jgi:hypothetical protein